VSKLTAFQRKLLYLGGILLLLIPITYLGMPPEAESSQRIKPGSGGKLSQLRQEYGLGEASMGNVDPTSSTMNLLLLGFRGIATTKLWMNAQDQQKRKEWSELDSTINSIVMLQPHFLKVWHFQGWNLAYNVSSEWDAVADRYYWVKRGVKFYKEGKDRNEQFPELYWFTGDTIGKKIGRADEWKQFRQFFVNEPDTALYPAGIDPEINPDRKDNYLVARDWFIESNRVASVYNKQQHIMAEPLFRFYPARALIDHAMVLQREGKFGEETRSAWEEAFNDWANVYGKQEYDCPIGKVRMELDEEEVQRYAAEDAKEPNENLRYLSWVARYQDMCNYRYWRTRCKIESDPQMAQAHQTLYNAEVAYREGNFEESIALSREGLELYGKMLEQFPDMKDDDTTIEEVMVAQLFWRESLRLVEGVEPDESEDYPLKELWQKQQPRKEQYMEEFQRRQRTGG
jgi:hypothetical protein